jgi:hypothetical protein
LWFKKGKGFVDQFFVLYWMQPSATSKVDEYSRAQHIVEFQSEVVVADPGGFVFAASSGAVLWAGQGRVSPQFEKTSLSKVDGAVPWLLPEQVAATQRMGLH